MLYFVQTGGFYHGPDNATPGDLALISDKGWAGRFSGKGNPKLESAHGIGPLPCAYYTLDSWEENHLKLGKMVAHLTPDPGSQMWGRDGFYIHGPSNDPSEYGNESMGCIVEPHPQRQAIKDTGDMRLRVISCMDDLLPKPEPVSEPDPIPEPEPIPEVPVVEPEPVVDEGGPVSA